VIMRHSRPYLTTWICTVDYMDLHSRLHGFAQSTTWICTVDYMDLQTQLHKYTYVFNCVMLSLEVILHAKTKAKLPCAEAKRT